MTTQPGTPPYTIRRLLIANRGEIACRIMRTAKRMGITSIAVYSAADQNARHVRSADEAYALGPAEAAQSYLNIDKLLALAERVGADSIHPGYGFLSENAAFARACNKAGIIFVGPPEAAIIAMGSKSDSKRAMQAVGVPTAPGYHGDEQSLARLQTEADRIGYPLIIKASVGGGGKGMQVVHASTEVASAVASAQRISQASFADDRLLLERYFPKARHVEVQVFADSRGNIVTLFDRDCSIQRRHQKIIEEAPAPGLQTEVRSRMSKAAIQATRAVDYVGAGTVEFLLDTDQQFYFMEMNTRLQVEHPVTELITGLDLVEWQLRVAQGESLPKAQEEIVQSGVAIEARIYAEDPANGYLPSVGKITHLRWPDTDARLRLDVGVDGGDEVSSFYDPLLGKIIALGATRSAAIARLSGAVDEIEIIGIVTNRALLAAVLGDANFLNAALATDFLSVQSHLIVGEPAATDEDLLLGALWYASANQQVDALWQDTSGWRLASPATTIWRFGDRKVSIQRMRLGHGAPNLYLGHCEVGHGEAQQVSMQLLARDASSMRVDVNARITSINLCEQGQILHLFRRRETGVSRHVRLRLLRTDDTLRASAVVDQGSLITPLPGTVVAVHVKLGEKVSKGDALVTLEAMKMEHTVTAPYDGRVAQLFFVATNRVTAGAVLLALEPA